MTETPDTHGTGSAFYQRSRTEDGIAVLTERMDTVRSVSLGIWIAAGSRDETSDEGGISHFLEHMMFKGTPTRSAQQISEAFDDIGAELNAFTSKEYTCYHFRVVDEHLAEGLEVMCDMVRNSKMDPDAVHSERQVVVEEIARRDDAPDEVVHEVLADTMWPEHPLGRTILGERDTVRAFEPDNARSYIDRRYVSGNVVVAAAGNVDHDELTALVSKGLVLPQGDRDGRGERSAVIEARSKIVTRDTEQSHICIGAGGLHSRDDDRFTLGIIDTVLGGGMSSRLFQEIREKRGLAYAVFSYHGQYLDAGAWVAYCGTRPENTDEVVGLLTEQIERVVADGITAEELARAKESIRGSLLLGLESTSARMGRLGKSEVTHGELLSVDEIVGRIDAVTLADVERVARATLGGPRVLTIVGPKKESELAHLLS